MERPLSEHRYPLVAKLILLGWVCLFLSSVCLFLSSKAWHSQSLLLSGCCMMVARVCGLIALGAGGLAIYNHRWLQGVLLLGGSVGMPMVSFLYYGFL
jgi:hypothetical protein